MKLLWKYLKPEGWTILSSLVLAGLAQVLGLLDPLILSRIIDGYAFRAGELPGDELARGVLSWLGLAVAVALGSRLLKAVQEYLMRRAVQGFGMRVFNDGLKQTMRLPYQDFEELRSGETLSLLQKVRTDTQQFTNAFITVVFSSGVGIGFLVFYSITRNWLLVPVFAVGTLVLGSLSGALSMRIKTVQRAINRETVKMAGAITESLRNIELVKSLGLTFPEIRRMEVQTRSIFDLEMEKVRRVRTLSFLQGAILIALKQSILFILLWLIFRRVLSPGELIAMQMISASIFGPLQDLGSIILSWREVENSLGNFDRLMARPIERKPEDAVEIGELEEIAFREVSFRHKTASSNAIDGISFVARRGQTLAFVGPSGSGKSTLVKLLLGLYKPAAGEISFNGTPSTRIRYNRLRRQLGLVTQDTQLFSGTIKDNLRFS